MEFENGQIIYQVYCSEFTKTITEFTVSKVNKKTLKLDGKHETITVKIDNFENHVEGVLKNSFIRYTDTLKRADTISIRLMDVIISIKKRKIDEHQRSINNCLSLRNTAPEIRRL